jgi:hypothetical protein
MPESRRPAVVLPTPTVPKIMLTLVLALVAGGALVTQAAAQSTPTVLVVEGPPTSEVGRPTTFQVTELFSHDPVPGAYLFSFGIDGPPGAEATLEPALADALLQPVAADAELRDDSFAERGGEFLGRTGPGGALTHVFGWPGHRLIFAVLPGTIPGYTTIEIVPPTVHALVIDGPDAVNALDTARYRVTSREDGSPEPNALVFAIPRGDGVTPSPSLAPGDADESIAAELAALADAGAADDALALDASSRWGAIFLGRTDANGVVTHAYADPDRYLVVAVKRLHWPAFMNTLVVPRQLVLSGPTHVRLGDPALYRVSDLTQSPVAGAYLYAFPVARALAPGSAGGAPEALDAALASSLADAEQLSDGTLSVWGGIFLGRTNADGSLEHTYRAPGDYVVVALKRSFRLDHTRTSVTANRLHIEGPGAVNAGDPARFFVGDAGGSPVERAAVFAIPRDRFPTPLAEDADPAALTTDPAIDAALLAALADDEERFRPDAVRDWGIVFVGWTDASGHVAHVFPAPENYVAVALKRQYLPGLTRLSVQPRQLVLDAPGAVQAGEAFRIAVSDLPGAPVANALVFAFPLPILSTAGDVDVLSDEALSDSLAAAAELGEGDAIDVSARWRGYLLGRTNAEGVLKAAIDAPGSHLLVAVKRSYRHAHARIEVLPHARQLVIAGPGTVEVNEPARFRVYEQLTEQPVPRVAMYAIPLAPLPQPLAAGDALSAAELDLAEAVLADPLGGEDRLTTDAVTRWNARFLGWTDADGLLVAEFGQPGRFLIVGLKPGFRGGFTHLAVVPPPQLRQLEVHGPGTAFPGEPVRFEVVEATSGAPVPRVAMYAIPHLTPIAGDLEAASSVADLAAADALLAEVAPTDDRLAEAVVVRWQARFLGWTDADGALLARFEAVGHYSIVGVR